MYPMVPTPPPPGHLSDRVKVNLIRSVSHYADTRTPASLLAEIQAILDGYTLDELVTLRERVGY